MDTNKPIVSIIIPCYKQAHFLPITLASVQAQTLANWECLIVDDGSPDETALLAKQWSANDCRYRYFHKENGGLSSARNHGLQQARGRYIQFLDSDDVILPSKLQIQVDQLSDCSPYSLSYCDYIRGGEADIYTPPNPPAPYLPPMLDQAASIYEIAADWETRLSIPAHCFLFNRIFFDEKIHFDETLENHEDWDCWMQIFRTAKDIRLHKEKLAIYRHHPLSMCQDLQRMREGFLKAIKKQAFENKNNQALQAILRAKYAEMDLNYQAKIHSASSSLQRFVLLAKKTLNKHFGN